LFLTTSIMSSLLSEPLYPFLPLNSITLLYLHIQLPTWLCGSTSFLFIVVIIISMLFDS
jgi:hypothetical protein